MISEIVKIDIGYQQDILGQLEKKLSYQTPSVNRLIDDIVSRRVPTVGLKLPNRYKSIDAEISEISVLYDGTELKGRVEYGSNEIPVVNIGDRGIIHMYGAGRTGLEVTAWAKRLLHMDFDVSKPGSDYAKPVRPGDLGIFCSGSWETVSTITYAKKTKEIGATTVAITSHPELVKVGEDCDYFIEIGGRDSLGEIRECYVEKLKGKSATQMDTLGAVFEFEVAGFKDIVAHILSERLGITEESMKKRHVTFE